MKKQCRNSLVPPTGKYGTWRFCMFLHVKDHSPRGVAYLQTRVWETWTCMVYYIVYYIIWKLTFLKQCALRLALITVSGASPQFNSLPGTTYHSPTNLPTTKFLSTGNIELWNNHDLSKMSLVITSVSIRFQCSVTSDFSPWEVIQCSYKVCRQLKTYGKFFSVMYYGILDFFCQLSTRLENIVNLRKVLFHSSPKC